MSSFAETIGKLIGLSLGILLPLVCIILNGVSLRKKTTNSLCALAIIGSLVAVMLFCLAGLGAQTVHVEVRTLNALVISAAALMLASTVLAITGLVRGARPRRYNRGRKRGIIALVLNAIYLTFFTIGLVEGVNQGAALRKMMQPSAPTQSVREAWTVQLQAPPGWSSIDPGEFGPETQAAIRRQDPEIFANVRAERLPDGADWSLTGAMNLIKKELNAGGEVEYLDESEEMEREYLGRTMQLRSQEANGAQFQVYWITRHRGVLYRIKLWGADADARRVREEAKKVIRGFTLIEPRQFESGSKNPQGKASSDANGLNPNAGAKATENPAGRTANPANAVPDADLRTPKFKDSPMSLSPAGGPEAGSSTFPATPPPK